MLFIVIIDLCVSQSDFDFIVGVFMHRSTFPLANVQIFWPSLYHQFPHDYIAMKILYAYRAQVLTSAKLDCSRYTNNRTGVISLKDQTSFGVQTFLH